MKHFFLFLVSGVLFLGLLAPVFQVQAITLPTSFLEQVQQALVSFRTFLETEQARILADTRSIQEQAQRLDAIRKLAERFAANPGELRLHPEQLTQMITETRSIAQTVREIAERNRKRTLLMNEMKSVLEQVRQLLAANPSS